MKDASTYIRWASVIAVAALLAVSGSRAHAQDPQAGPPSGMGQRQGGRGGRMGGFGMGQPVQGIVTAVSGNKVTIKTEAGDVYEVTPADNARIMEDRQQIKLSDIKPGDSVTAMGQVDATKKTVSAMFVNAIDAATVAKAKANLGVTYITGKITAIDADNLKLTVLRTDNQSQVIAVDDGTSFQRGTRGVAADVVAAGGLPMGGGFGGRGMGGGRRGEAGGAPPAPESITLADIKVGDTVMATGSVKGGTFTVAKMGISEPGAGARPGPGGAMRPGGEGGQQQPPPPPDGEAPPPATPPR